ncbi:penicillin-binding protein 2 [bacterium]|nr:penicillin-binding protein 2 [bacterium]MBU1956879.1 penicillin-binding protein 2 [bacterium]
MHDAHIENRMIRYRSAILLAFFIGIFFLLVIFLVTIAKTMSSERQTDDKFVSVENKAIRGKIISADNFVVSYSQKQFRAEVHTQSIDPKKKDLFVKLFSIYSGISEKEVLSKFIYKGKAIQGRVVLCDDLDVRLASDLTSLGYKMNKMDIFRPLDPKKPHLVFGLDILPSSETRYFPHKKLLTPLVGYVRTEVNNDYKTPRGIKGLEKAYSDYLKPEVNGLIKGKRDVLGTPLRDGKSREVKRADGMNLHLNIELDFQRSVEKVIDDMKLQVAAQEIMVAVMDSRTGKILSLATSERFDPKNIQQNEVPSLNPNFSEYLYEPGSVMKPLTLAIALDKNRVNLNKPIVLGGKFKVNENYTITDDDYFKELTPKGIIMYSSNIGISKIAWKLSGKELYDGWRNFGISKRSGIDLSRELIGRIKTASQLDHKVHSANMAYGYGMFANFMQMIKAYSAFNNNGIAVTPKIVNHLSDQKGRLYDIDSEVHSVHACSLKTAATIHDMLLATVNRGTGTAAQYDGLEVGGKTGTAHIAHRGRYIEAYHSSFYGFVNDKEGHKYTVGVFVIKPKKVYFSSHTAAPTFHKVIDKMVKHNYLVVDETLAAQHLDKRAEMRKKKHDAYVRKIKAYNQAHGIE